MSDRVLSISFKVWLSWNGHLEFACVRWLYNVADQVRGLPLWAEGAVVRHAVSAWSILLFPSALLCLCLVCSEW